MRKVALFFFITTLISCSSTKEKTASKELYKVLYSNEIGGNKFRFYELITEPNEFEMLLNDPLLKKYVKIKDIDNSNFILLNAGEKTTSGYKIEVSSVEELADKIIITVKEVTPSKNQLTSQIITTPFCIVKINSKKQIEIK